MSRYVSALVLALGLVCLGGLAWSQDDAARGLADRFGRFLGNPDTTFPKMDADKDSKVSKDEFVKYVTQALRGRVKAESVGPVFELGDADKSGFVSLEELKKLLSGSTTENKPDAKTNAKAKAKNKAGPPPAKPDPPKVVHRPRAWKSGANAALQPAKLDQLLLDHIQADEREPAPLVNDEQFLRRVTLDFTGKPPAAAAVVAFLKDSDPNRRAKYIDQLLASEDFGRHWGNFWKDVIQSKASSTLVIFDLHRGDVLQSWLAEQFNANRSWAESARDMIVATGNLFVPGPTVNGAVGFLMCHNGPEGPVGRAADTTRVFMGIQLECAQCHNHPTDIWKRQQFHELAAYFGRTKEAQVKGQGTQRGLEIGSKEKGEYEMPDKTDPTKTTTTHPRFFLNGQALGEDKDDMTRRRALADLVTGSDWFAKAFVNRTWGQLMGRAFVEPVDAMGPKQEPIFPVVLDALAASFRASDCNIKELFGTIANSRAYQQQIRMGETRSEHMHFAGAYPTRMRGDVMWDSLTVALGSFATPDPLPEGLREVLERIRKPDYFTIFKRQFDFDPTAAPDDIEGSVTQTLVLMNNKAINARITVTGDTPLAKIVKECADDGDAIHKVYLQALSRPPSAREVESCRAYVEQVGNRNEAFEDLMWVLLNSAEFKTRQ